jgi:erythromycin esterase
MIANAKSRTLLTAVATVLFWGLPAVQAHAQRSRPVEAPGQPRTAAEWLVRTAVPFLTSEARSGLRDLEPLRAMIGDARIVSLGEATHGTREFFTMKHRILEFLVEEMGFTVFGIEANLPEADAVDDYVMHGRGDAAAALRGMYFWTWDTDEVLDQIQWMREYNLRRGDRPAVRFRGVDMQYIRVAVPKVQEYVARVDPAREAEVRALYGCITRYTPEVYRSLVSDVRSRCRADVTAVHDLIAARTTEYAAASSEEKYQRLLRYARVVVQAEASWSNVGRRDDFMAENAEWLAETLHRGEKVVLWSHNMHAAASEPWMMGNRLRRTYGREMVIIGFDFRRGSFTAISGGRLTANTIAVSPANGYEEFFAQAGYPRLIVDLRNPSSAAAAEYLAQRRSLWAIGSLWDGTRPDDFRYTTVLPQAFDIIIYIEETTASRVRR